MMKYSNERTRERRDTREVGKDQGNPKRIDRRPVFRSKINRRKSKCEGYSYGSKFWFVVLLSLVFLYPRTEWENPGDEEIRLLK